MTRSGLLPARAVFPLPGGDALVFEHPKATWVATRVESVRPLLREVDAALAAGQWIAGHLAYEAAPAFDPALVTCDAGNALAGAEGRLPLAWFGVFGAPRREPLAAALRNDDEAAALESAAAPGNGDETATTLDAAAALAWTPSIDAETHAAQVAAVRDAIARGDTYQVNLTWRLRAPFAGSASALFARLLAAQPVPHAAYLDLGGHAICSASPELLFRRRGPLLVCRPMKGTAPRGRFAEEDAARAAALAASSKERAENLMIVDMVRNDLGRVARAGSVAVRDLFRCERYATLWQLTSTVTAQSDAPLSAVLAALFPSASVTGAPKARTMGLIAELEREPRGIYTGTIGWAGPGGRARFNVAIRTVWIDRRRGIAEYGTGGGVTWDSDPAAELAESRLKASVLAQPRPDFELLETMCWSPARGFVRVEAHLARMARSARYFGFRRGGSEGRALDELARTLPPIAHRVRLLLARDGAVRVEAEPLAAFRMPSREPRRRLRVGLAPAPVDATDPLLFHKTTRRALYDAARAAVPGCDDALLWNAHGELTESTRANLVVRLDGALVTPPLAGGLLPGVLRERLLARHRIAERIVGKEDLTRATGIWLINSLRGWLPVELVSHATQRLAALGGSEPQALAPPRRRT